MQQVVLEKEQVSKASRLLVRVLRGERYTPYSLALKLKASVLLESASFQRGRARWSLLLVKEAGRLIQQGRQIFLDRHGKRFRLKGNYRDILDVAAYFANQHADANMESPLPAGGVGFIGYECAGYFDTIRLTSKTDPFGLPDAAFILGHVFIIFDHFTDSIILLGLNYKELVCDLSKALDEIEARLNDLDFNFMTPERPLMPATVISGHDKSEEYMRGVEKVREEIIRGNLLQGVLSRRLILQTELKALEGYRHLRSFNPSPYMFYLNFDDYELFGASPEVHLKVQGRTALIRPLAGTRPRGQDRLKEEELERELLADEKERAEHLMLVDLARNDLGRVCEAGSVKPTELMVIEKYSHVMHIVSEVVGTLRPDCTGIDALRASFPAGTVSGAPKIRAIEVLDRLEKDKRSFYAGAVGYIAPGGELDTCIVIRSALKKDDKIVLQAGAGVVYDSLPHREYQETENKLKALCQAVGLEV